MEYNLKQTSKYNYEETIEKATELLKEQGFGVLTEIDVKATLKKKIDVDFDRYIILGACNPKFAHQALTKDRQVGVLLPCNVVVQELDGKVVVSAFNPALMDQVAPESGLADIASEVQSRLKQVLEGLAG